MRTIWSILQSIFDAGFTEESAAVRTHVGGSHLIVTEEAIDELFQPSLSYMEGTLAAASGCFTKPDCYIILIDSIISNVL